MSLHFAHMSEITFSHVEVHNDCRLLVQVSKISMNSENTRKNSADYDENDLRSKLEKKDHLKSPKITTDT